MANYKLHTVQKQQGNTTATRESLPHTHQKKKQKKLNVSISDKTNYMCSESKAQSNLMKPASCLNVTTFYFLS